MPELPEVEIVRRGLEPALIGRTIMEVKIRRRDLRLPVPADFEAVLQGQKVASTHRRGKYILVFMQNGRGFVLHLGMSGRVHIYGPSDTYKPGKHDHSVFLMSDGTQIVYNDPRRFGMLYLTQERDWQAEKPFSAMGPEPLGNDFNGPVLSEALKGRRAPIKTALLDQRVVSGIGNIYACEALYEAGIAPGRMAGSLKPDETEKLASSIRAVLERAIKAGGSTLKDYRHTDGALGYFQNSFSVYDREGQSCPACIQDNLAQGCVTRIMQGGRSTFYCARRQR